MFDAQEVKNLCKVKLVLIFAALLHVLRSNGGSIQLVRDSRSKEFCRACHSGLYSRTHETMNGVTFCIRVAPF